MTKSQCVADNHGGDIAPGMYDSGLVPSGLCSR